MVLRMDIRQILRRKNDGTLVLDLPIWFRAALGVITVAMIGLMISDGRVYPLPLIFALASGAGALYTQGWVFDPRTGRITSRHGLLLLARTTVYEATEAEALILDRFSPGAGARKRSIRLRLLLRDGEQPVLEIQRAASSNLLRYAQAVSAAMSLRLDDRSPEDGDGPHAG